MRAAFLVGFGSSNDGSTRRGVLQWDDFECVNIAYQLRRTLLLVTPDPNNPKPHLRMLSTSYSSSLSPFRVISPSSHFTDGPNKPRLKRNQTNSGAFGSRDMESRLFKSLLDEMGVEWWDVSFDCFSALGWQILDPISRRGFLLVRRLLWRMLEVPADRTKPLGSRSLRGSRSPTSSLIYLHILPSSAHLLSP